MIHAYIQEPPGDQTPLRPTAPHGYLREVCHEPLQVTRMVAAIAECAPGCRQGTTYSGLCRV